MCSIIFVTHLPSFCSHTWRTGILIDWYHSGVFNRVSFWTIDAIHFSKWHGREWARAKPKKSVCWERKQKKKKVCTSIVNVQRDMNMTGYRRIRDPMPYIWQGTGCALRREQCRYTYVVCIYGWSITTDCELSVRFHMILDYCVGNAGHTRMCALQSSKLS